MLSVSRRSVLLFAFASVLTGAQVLAVSAPSPARPVAATECGRLEAWAEAYRGRQPSLRQVAMFDRAHGIAIFNAVSPAVRASLWREQLAAFSRATELSAEQRRLVVEGMMLVTPALYQHEETSVAAFSSFWRRADKAFTAPSLRAKWFDLGGVSQVRAPAGAAAEWCECNLWAGDCPNCAPVTCLRVGGCGPIGMSQCNGACQ